MKGKGKDSLFTDEDLYGIPQSGLISIDNDVVRGKSSIKTKQVIQGGKEIYVRTDTVNIKKIQDTCIELIQGKNIRDKIDYDKFIVDANNELKETFIKYKLIENPKNSAALNKKILEIKELAIAKNVKEEFVN
jgi:hypothetical protein